MPRPVRSAPHRAQPGAAARGAFPRPSRRRTPRPPFFPSRATGRRRVLRVPFPHRSQPKRGLIPRATHPIARNRTSSHSGHFPYRRAPRHAVAHGACPFPTREIELHCIPPARLPITCNRTPSRTGHSRSQRAESNSAASRPLAFPSLATETRPHPARYPSHRPQSNAVAQWAFPLPARATERRRVPSAPFHRAQSNAAAICAFPFPSRVPRARFFIARNAPQPRPAHSP